MSKTISSLVGLIVFAGLAASAQTNSQQTSTLKRPSVVSDSGSTNGVRVSLLRPMLEYQFKASSSYGSFDDKIDIDNMLGLAVGYAYLPAWSLGFTSNLAYMQMQTSQGDGTRPELARLDANLAYTFRRDLNVKAGLNFAKFTKVAAAEYQGQLGGQIGAGLQITKHVGVDLSYVLMRQTADMDGVHAEVREVGPEFAISGTF